MDFSTIGNTIRPPRLTPRLTCPANLWAHLLAELRERGGGYREAGAFLLGRRDNGGCRRVEAFLLYDDVDPSCLRGWIEFDGSKMDEVWRRCEVTGLSVVADLHTHPGGYAQSDIDQANPMIPEIGHVAIIVPNYARGAYGPGAIGVYEFMGRGQWQDHSAKGARYFRLEAAR